MTRYKKFEDLWESKYGDIKKEYKFVRDLVGDGPGVRERINRLKLQDWRLDYAILGVKVYLEIQGFGFGHQGNKGFLRDMRKHNCLVLNGWRGLYFPPGTVIKSPEYVVEQLENLIRLIDRRFLDENRRTQ